MHSHFRRLDGGVGTAEQRNAAVQNVEIGLSEEIVLRVRDRLVQVRQRQVAQRAVVLHQKRGALAGRQEGSLQTDCFV